MDKTIIRLGRELVNIAYKLAALYEWHKWQKTARKAIRERDSYFAHEAMEIAEQFRPKAAE